MKKFILAGAALVAGAGVAAAADLPRSAPYYTAPAPLSAYSWVGPYIGVNLGYHWGSVTNDATSPSGPAAGVQAGYNWQSGQFVFGGETDLQMSGAEDTFAPYKFSNPWFGTLRARAGYAYNNFLFYGTGGLAYGSVTGEIAGLSESRTHIGWTIGLGVEMSFSPNWTAKAEYLYMDLADRDFTVTGTSNGFESNLLRLGVNYHF